MPHSLLCNLGLEQPFHRPSEAKMPQKTWFLPPDFTFLPTGELALGTVIPHPSRPTLALASLDPDTHPEIALPSVVTIVEPNHNHSRASGGSIGFDLFAKVVDLASASGATNVSRYKNRSFGDVDHEVRVFSRALGAEALKAIVALPEVKRYINGGRFGTRPVYIISGLRVARDSFPVTDRVGSATSVELGASGPAPSAPVPLEVGGAISGSRDRDASDTYKTAPGIVFAYRLHVVREKRDGAAESELFSHRTAFFSGEAGDSDDEGAEMECVDVNAETLMEDLDVDPDFDEYPIGDECCVVLRGKRDK